MRAKGNNKKHMGGTFLEPRPQPLSVAQSVDGLLNVLLVGADAADDEGLAALARQGLLQHLKEDPERRLSGAEGSSKAHAHSIPNDQLHHEYRGTCVSLLWRKGACERPSSLARMTSLRASSEVLICRPFICVVLSVFSLLHLIIEYRRAFNSTTR